MHPTDLIKSQIATDGFAILENIYSSPDIDQLLAIISNASSSKPTFAKRLTYLLSGSF